MKNPEAEVAVNSSAKESRHVNETTATHPNPNSAKKIFVLLSSKKSETDHRPHL